MNKLAAPIVISIGGSIVVPKEGIDVPYLEAFRKVILTHIRQGSRFIIVVGGGHTARAYQQAANRIVHLASEDVDWLGIHATRLNGHLLRALFRDQAIHRVVKDPTRPLNWRASVLIAAGWKPGWSTDYIAVRLAQKFKATQIINLTNIDAVYDKDPSQHEDAEPYDALPWKEFRKLIPATWSPGANAPFDPIASRLAEKCGMSVVITRGTDLKNLQKILDGKKYKGTIIS
jgi:uridylate kinase